MLAPSAELAETVLISWFPSVMGLVTVTLKVRVIEEAIFIVVAGQTITPGVPGSLPPSLAVLNVVLDGMVLVNTTFVAASPPEFWTTRE